MAEDFANVIYEVHELPHVRNQTRASHHGNCEKCLYWQTLKDGFPTAEQNVRGVRGDQVGECRVHAPQYVGNEVKWPVTYEFDWCGEFKARAGKGGLAAGS